MLTVRSDLPQELEDLAASILGVLGTVHRLLGPGFKERIYQRAVCLELDARGISFESEKEVLVPYKQWQIPGHRLDLLVAGLIILELKAVPKLKEIHRYQVLSYLRATGLRLGLVVNFNAPVLKGNVKRVVL